MQNNFNERCYCGSGLDSGHCCLPIIEGRKSAETAEALMRSRYTAYVIRDEDYLLSSWHTDTRPRSLSLDEGEVSWTGLSLIRCRAGMSGDKKGEVEFIASYEQAGKAGKVHENSRFIFEQGQWFYVDGDEKYATKTGRNSPCPCGSGKKYKKCCAP